MFQLRPYQQSAVDAAIAELKSSREPFIIEAAGGAGKSVIIAEIARIIHGMTGKRVLCTAPTSELVVQDRAKYLATGNPCSMFSASAGPKSLRHPVIFGSPLTIKNRISAFKRDFAMIVIDECDLITPTVKAVIEEMREGNPNLRVVGLTATPYRRGSGYIYREELDGTLLGEDQAREPYFGKNVFRITARELIGQGYLTPPLIGAINTEAYDTSGLLLNRMGNFDAKAVDKAYHGWGRKSAMIVQDIVAQSQNRNGVLLYAATIQHAQEILASLPPELSTIITGGTKDRQAILKAFAKGRYKYVVNVGVLTVGVDLPHVDVIAVLRKMESIRLLQQIAYRGTRLFPDKENFLFLDYGQNFETHCPSGDLFAPAVKVTGSSSGGSLIEAECPSCSHLNEFTVQPDYVDFKMDKHGYCLDVFGSPLMSDHGPVAGHYGRRCFGFVLLGKEYERCGYRWTFKTCEACQADNDISARYCCICKSELIDPAAKLIAEFVAAKKDPSIPSTDRVLKYETRESVSQKGNRTLRVDFVTEFKQFSIWLMPEPTNARAASAWARWEEAEGDIRTVSYVREPDSQFWRVLAYNRPADDEELPGMLADAPAVAKIRKYAA